MSKVLLCLGSNSDAQRHVEITKRILRQMISDIRFSQSVWTEPIGSVSRSPLYLNCLAEGESSMDYTSLHQKLKEVERTLGSTAEERHKGIVRIDVDILMLNGQRYHEDDWERSYVKSLLAQLQC